MIEKALPEAEGREVEDQEFGALPDGRYLLFDSGCLACTAIAGLVEQETQGWLSARSLQEPEVRASLSKARPNWKHEPTLLEVEGEKALALTGLAMKARMLVGLGPRKASRVAKIASGKGVRGMEMTLTATEGDPGRYAVGSMKLLDRRTALKTMGAFGLAATLLPGLPAGAFAQSAAGSDIPVAARDARIRTVRLSFRETMRRFEKMRGEDNRLRMLHKNMTDKGFRLVRGDSVGLLTELIAGNAVIRELSINLKYKKPNGQTAIFSGRAELVKAGSVELMDRIRPDYTVRDGKRLDTFAVKDGRVRNVQRIDDWVKERERLRRRGSQDGRGSRAGEDVSPKSGSACSVCLTVAPIVIGVGCFVYSSYVVTIACAVAAATILGAVFCAIVVGGIYTLVCSAVTSLLPGEACADAGYC